MRLPPSLSPLGRRDFRIYWIGQLISLVGTWMQAMAQGWVVTELSASAQVIGVLGLVSSLPLLFLSLTAGSVADRYEKRKILIFTQLGLMFLAFAFAALTYSGEIALWNVFLVATLLGVVTAFDLPASQALPPERDDPPEISKAVALMQPIFHGARLIGPARKRARSSNERFSRRASAGSALRRPSNPVRGRAVVRPPWSPLATVATI